MRVAVAAGLLVLAVAAGAASSAGEDAEARGGPAAGVPLGLPPELAAHLADEDGSAALGRRLFFAPVLSADRSLACAGCHEPEHGFAGTTPLGTGVAGRSTLRNVPTLLNRALGASFMWDGAAATLEEQVLLPIENEREMDLPLDEALARLAGDPGWAAAFAEVYGGPPTRARLADALASYVRGLLHGGTRVDRFRAGEREALTPAERGGLWLYESRAGCWRCHSGPNFTDEGFHNTGVRARDGRPAEGRGAVTGEPADRGRFKTPTLRGLTLTAPYMHDGSLATLEEVVEFYRRGGGANDDLSSRIAPIELSDADAASLVAFLRALSEPASEPSGGTSGDSGQ